MDGAKIEFLLAQARITIDGQWDSANRLSTRASALIGVSLTLLGIYIVFLPVWTTPLGQTVGVAALSLLLVSLGLAVAGYLSSKFRYGVDIETLMKEGTSELKDIQWSALRKLVGNAVSNIGSLRQSFRLVNASLIVLPIAVLVFAIGILVRT